jgi:uncharacterized repeat protein (TIGR01451 family)
MKRVVPAILIGAMTLLTGCVQRSEGGTQVPDGADIVVTATGPTAPIGRGKSAEFRIKVANAGPHDATDVTIIDTIGTQSVLVAMSCTATGGAVCPDPVGLTMKVPTLPKGDELDFVVTLKLAALPTGIIIDSLVANFDKDGDPNNNSIAVDAVVR